VLGVLVRGVESPQVGATCDDCETCAAAAMALAFAGFTGPTLANAASCRDRCGKR
jgi:hypothetical protein